MKKTLVFDFDGVIHSYTSGWTGPDNIPDPVVKGIKEAIDELRENGYWVAVVSTRCKYPEGTAAIKEYLYKNGIKVDEVSSEKPPAICYIDDRAIRFDGDASAIVEQVKNFHSWTEPNFDPAANTRRFMERKKSQQGCVPRTVEQDCKANFARLRRCKAVSYAKNEAREVMGWFHGWGADYEEFETGPGNFTVAIIEQDDGRVVTCPAHTVQFLDGGAPHITELTMRGM